MNYERIIYFIKSNYDKRQQELLMKYVNSRYFEQDLDDLMYKQLNMNEPLTQSMAIECVLESYLQNEEQY